MLPSEGVQLRRDSASGCSYLGAGAFIAWNSTFEAYDFGPWLQLPGLEGPMPSSTTSAIHEFWREFANTPRIQGVEPGEGSAQSRCVEHHVEAAAA